MREQIILLDFTFCVFIVYYIFDFFFGYIHNDQSGNDVYNDHKDGNNVLQRIKGKIANVAWYLLCLFVCLNED